MTTWHTAPSDVIARLTVTGGFPAPDVTVTFEVAGPDLANPSPTNYVAQTPQTKTGVAVNSSADFKLTLTQLGFYSIRVTAILSNPLGQVTIGPQVVSIGIGQAPSGTVS